MSVRMPYLCILVEFFIGLIIVWAQFAVLIINLFRYSILNWLLRKNTGVNHMIENVFDEYFNKLMAKVLLLVFLFVSCPVYSLANTKEPYLSRGIQLSRELMNVLIDNKYCSNVQECRKKQVMFGLWPSNPYY